MGGGDGGVGGGYAKTAADTAARLAPQFGNSVSCTGAGREEPSWCFFHCLESPCYDMESPGTALIAAASDFPSRRWVKAIGICRSVFPDLAPFTRTLFLGIVNLQRNRQITIKKIPIEPFTPHHHPPPARAVPLTPRQSPPPKWSPLHTTKQ